MFSSFAHLNTNILQLSCLKISEREIFGFNRARIIALYEGFLNYHNSSNLNIPKASVIQLIHRYKETGVGRIHGRPRGRSCVSIERDAIYLIQFTSRNRNEIHTSEFIFKVHFSESFLPPKF